jgi:glycosyltransferase involved in cell wall biosynthesis
MFLGLAPELRRKMGVPILCTLQGEDLFLEQLREPHQTRAKNLLRRRARDISGFVATSNSYADFMSGYLDVPRERIHVVPLGLNLNGHGVSPARSVESPVTIGYLARICPEKGLHLLVDAFDLLVKRLGKEQLLLQTAGYLGPRDHAYFEEIQARIAGSGWQNRFRHWGEIDRHGKIAFLGSLDILSVPTVYRDPKGLFVLEALANQVAVVQPAHGAFPELIGTTGGGRLVEPNSAEALAEGLQYLIESPEVRRKMAVQGKEAVFRNFNTDVLADNALAVYRQYL